jgi:hypothetical protein
MRGLVYDAFVDALDMAGAVVTADNAFVPNPNFINAIISLFGSIGVAGNIPG